MADPSFATSVESLGVPIALTLAYLIVALAYMASKVFQSRHLEEWSKVELHEAFISTIMAASILALVGIFDNILEALGRFGLGTSIENMSTAAAGMVGIAMDLVMKIAGMHAYSSLLAWLSYNPSATFDVLGMGKLTSYVDASPLLFFSYVLDPLTVLQTVAVGGLFAVIAQYVVLIVIRDTFLTFMVPFGLVLRAFPITRKLGSSLLAIFVGAYIFYPLGLGLMMSSTCHLTYYSPGLCALNEIIGRGVGTFAISLMDFLKKLLDLFVLPLYVWKFTDNLVTSVCGGWSNFICAPPVAMLALQIWLLIWIVDIILTVVNLLIGLIGFIAAFVLTIEALAIEPSQFAESMTESILEYIAGYSVLYAFAFFTPVFTFMFTLLGIRSMLTMFGGDEAIVNMLYFL